MASAVSVHLAQIKNRICCEAAVNWVVGCSPRTVVSYSRYKTYFTGYLHCLQCFDTVGWVAGRASGL